MEEVVDGTKGTGGRDRRRGPDEDTVDSKGRDLTHVYVYRCVCVCVCVST